MDQHPTIVDKALDYLFGALLVAILAAMVFLATGCSGEPGSVPGGPAVAQDPLADVPPGHLPATADGGATFSQEKVDGSGGDSSAQDTATPDAPTMPQDAGQPGQDAEPQACGPQSTQGACALPYEVCGDNGVPGHCGHFCLATSDQASCSGHPNARTFHFGCSDPYWIEPMTPGGTDYHAVMRAGGTSGCEAVLVPATGEQVLCCP